MPDVLRGLRCAVRACGLISLEVGMIVCVDVDYQDVGAVAACVCFEAWGDAVPAAETVVQIGVVEPYVPGMFYRREFRPLGWRDF